MLMLIAQTIIGIVILTKIDVVLAKKNTAVVELWNNRTTAPNPWDNIQRTVIAKIPFID